MRNDAIETINERSTINSPPKIILHPRSFNHESLKAKAFSDVAVIVITYEGLDFTLYIYIINQMETTI